MNSFCVLLWNYALIKVHGWQYFRWLHSVYICINKCILFTKCSIFVGWLHSDIWELKRQEWRQKKLYSFLYLWGTRMSTKYYDTTQQAIILFLSHTKIRPKILEWWIYFNRCRSYVLPDSKMRRHSTVGHKNYWTYAKVLDTCFCVYFWVPAVSVQLACHSECSIMRLDVR